MRALRGWLSEPQKTNQQALVVGVIASLIVLALGYAARALLALADVIAFRGSIPIWLGAVVIGAVTGVSSFAVRRRHQAAIEAETYFEHVRDALADLRRNFAGELPSFSLRDFVGSGVFHPAERLLTRGRQLGDVRFSILHPDDDGEKFHMASDELYPALGHSAESREKFELPIAESFSGLAFRTGRVLWSNKLSDDDRYTPHPMARKGREYESMVSVPLWKSGEVDGVFNVVATAENAFSATDRIYITLLGSVIDVARVNA